MNDNPTTADEQYKLGERYQKGDGVAKDLEMAKYWYAKAAAQGSISADFALSLCKYVEELEKVRCRGAGNDASVKLVEEALMLQSGNKSNPKKEAALYKKAAKKGHMGAQYAFGECCEKGYGVYQNKYDAFDWYTKAAEQGHTAAQIKLGEF